MMRRALRGGGLVTTVALCLLWGDTAQAGAPAGERGTAASEGEGAVTDDEAKAKAKAKTKAGSQAKPEATKSKRRASGKRSKVTDKDKDKDRATDKDPAEEFEEALRSRERVFERRRRAEERAAKQIEEGAPLEAARDLSLIAELDGDPALMIGAAEAALEGVGVTPGAEEAAQFHIGNAKARLQALSASEDEYALLRRGLEEEELAKLEVRLRAASTRASVASARAKREKERSRSVRLAKGELVSGAVLAGLGASGLAIMASGIYLRRSADRELSAAGVDDLSELQPELAAPFERQYEQASTLTAGGAVLGAAGTALGVTLIVAGVRDLKRAGWRASARASLRGAPTVGRGAAGLVIGGRF